MHDSCGHFSRLRQRYNNSDHATFLRDSCSVRESLKQHYLKVICFVRELARLLYIICRVKIMCICQALYRGNAPVLRDDINILTKYLEVGMEPLPYVVCWKHRSSWILSLSFFCTVIDNIFVTKVTLPQFKFGNLRWWRILNSVFHIRGSVLYIPCQFRSCVFSCLAFFVTGKFPPGKLVLWVQMALF